MTAVHRELIGRIRESAAALRTAVAGVPAGAQDRPPRAGEWSVRETLVHLRNVVLMVQGLRLRRLFCESDPLFADYDEAAFRMAGLARGEPIGSLADAIVAEHEQTARLLSHLPDDQWTRQGRHPDLGFMSIELLARRMGEHTAEHAEQIAATVQALQAAR